MLQTLYPYITLTVLSELHSAVMNSHFSSIFAREITYDFSVRPIPNYYEIVPITIAAEGIA